MGDDDDDERLSGCTAIKHNERTMTILSGYHGVRLVHQLEMAGFLWSHPVYDMTY